MAKSNNEYHLPPHFTGSNNIRTEKITSINDKENLKFRFDDDKLMIEKIKNMIKFVDSDKLLQFYYEYNLSEEEIAKQQMGKNFIQNINMIHLKNLFNEFCNNYDYFFNDIFDMIAYMQFRMKKIEVNVTDDHNLQDKINIANYKLKNNTIIKINYNLKNDFEAILTTIFETLEIN